MFGQMLVERTTNLVKKFIAIKTIPFLTATIAILAGKMDSWMWFGTALLLVSARLLEKIFVKTPTVGQ
jgi:hypothetical protein